MHRVSALSLFPVVALFGFDGERWPKEPTSELFVARACHDDALQGWFPRHHLKMPMEKPEADDPQEVERRLAPRRCYAGDVLRSYQEPVLARGSMSETYRLIYSPAFFSAIVIRVEDFGGRYFATVKQNAAKGSALTGDFKMDVSEVSASDFAAIRRAAERAECWNEEHTCHAELSAEPGVVSVDGESWLLEGARRADHWGVVIDNPIGGPFLAVCAAIVRAAQAERHVKLPDQSSAKIGGSALRRDGGVE